MSTTSASLIEAQDIDGTTVHIQGSAGPTVVMVHGWPDTHRLWDPQVELLAPAHRCVRFTLPGFDLSKARRALNLDEMVAHLAAIVDAVSPNQAVTLLLHDWGAVYGWQYAMRHPRRVARIIAVDIGDTGSGEYLRSLPLSAKLGIAAYQGCLALAYQLPAALGDALTRQMASWLRAPAPRDDIAAAMNHPYVSFFRGGFKAAARVSPACPTLYFYGKRKPFQFQAAAWLERIAAVPGNEVHAMPTGHWVMVQRPAEFNGVVMRWLAQTPA